MMTEQDPFADVRLKSNQPIQQKAPQQAQESTKEDPFAAVRLKKDESFPWLYEGSRHVTRTASRLAETIGGLPGDVASLIQSGVFKGLEKLTGMPPPPPEVLKLVKQHGFPTSSELQEFSEKESKGFTTPQNDYEKTGDEYTKIVGSLLGPMKFRSAIGVALAGQAGKESGKILGVGEGSQEALKLGSIFMATMFNPGGAMKYASSQYEKANSLAKGASVAAKSLENNLNVLTKDLAKGISTPPKTTVIKAAEEVLLKVNNGKIAVQDLTSAKRDLNTLMKNPEMLTREKKLLKGIAKEVDQAIVPYEKINPDFAKAYRPANEIYGAIAEGNKASNFVLHTLGQKSFIGAVLGEAVLGHTELVLPTAGLAAGAVAGAKGVDFITRMSKSKELQKFYAKAIEAALLKDAPTLRLYEKKIQQEMNNSQ